MRTSLKQNQLSQNLTSYGLAAAAVTSFLAVDAEAAVVTYDNGGAGWSSVNATGPLLSLNMAGEVRTDGTQPAEMQFEFQHAVSTSKLTYDKLSVINGPGIGTNGTFAPAANPARLAPGTTIGANDNTPASTGSSIALAGTFNGVPAGVWGPEDRGFLGLAFKNGSETNYGWADITVHNPNSITLNSFGYETVGGADVITPVPEPAISTLLMAGGATGLLALRRRRKRAAEAKAA